MPLDATRDAWTVAPFPLGVAPEEAQDIGVTPPPAGIAFAAGMLFVVCLGYALAVRALGGISTAGLSIGTGVIAGMLAWAGEGVDPPDAGSPADAPRGLPIDPDEARADAVVSDIDCSRDGGAIRPDLERVRPIRRR